MKTIKNNNTENSIKYLIEITEDGSLLDTANSLEEAYETVEEFEKEEWEKTNSYTIYKVENWIKTFVSH